MKGIFRKISILLVLLLAFAINVGAEVITDVETLNSPVEVEFIGYKAKFAHQTGESLRDGKRPNDWTTNDVFYFSESGHYLEVNIPEKCNIWRSGTTSWSHENGSLILYKWVEDKYVNVTAEYGLPTSQITNSQWEKFVTEMPEGRYKFAFNSGYRLDSEWYFESVNDKTDTVIELSVAQSYKQFTLDWTDVSGTYIVKRSENDSEFTIIADDITSNTYIDTDIMQGTRYRYIIEMQDSDSNTIASNIKEVYLKGSEYLIVELYDHYSSDYANLHELEVYDINNKKISYEVVEGYDLSKNGRPHYWANSSMGQAKLSDGSTNSHARYMYSSGVDSDAWTRLVLKLDDNQGVGRVDTWLSAYRMQEITIYEAIEYDLNKNVKLRNNEDLKYLGQALIDDGDTLKKISIEKSILVAPRDFEVKPGSSQATLNWEAVEGATGYRVKRSYNEEGPYTLIANNILDTNYVDKTAVNGSTYYYQVLGMNEDGEGAVSPSKKVTISASEYLIVELYDHYSGDYANLHELEVYDINNKKISYEVVEGYDLSKNGRPHYWGTGSMGQIKLSDDDTNSYARYMYSSGVNSDAWTRLVLKLDDNQGVGRVDTWLSAYRMQEITIYEAIDYDLNKNVKLRNNEGLRYLGQALIDDGDTLKKISIEKSVLVAPRDFEVKPGSSQATLNWEAVEGATGYRIKRSYNEEGPYTVIANNVLDTNYVDKTAVNGSTYYYQVLGMNEDGEGAVSPSKKVTISASEYLIVELYDHYSGDYANLYELEVYDINNKKISYEVVEGYDLSKNGRPHYWANSSMGQDKLSDGSTNSHARYMYSSGVDSDAWTRLVLKLDDNQGVGRVDTWLSAYRMQEITIYEAIDYDLNKNVKLRNNEGLRYLGQALIDDGDTLKKISIEKSVLVAPRDFEVKPGSSQANLNWKAVEGATGYRVKRSYNEEGPYTVIANNILDTNYVDKTVVNGSTYYYQVLGMNEDGEGAVSPSKKVTISASEYLIVELYDHYSGDYANLHELEVYDINNKKINYEVVEGYDLSKNGRPHYWGTGSMGQIKLSDDDTNSYARYMYSSGVNSDAWTRLVLKLDDNQGVGRVDTWLSAYRMKEITIYEAIEYDLNKNVKLRNNEDLRYLGQALIDDGDTLKKISIEKSALVAPRGFEVKPGSSQASLNWGAVEGATGYRVKRSYNEEGPYTVIANNVLDTNYVDKTAVNGSTYYYQVLGMNEDSEGAVSPSKKATISASKYLIVELYDHYSGDYANLHELEVYDINNKQLSYEVVEGYDLSKNGRPHYWSNSSMGQDKLSDESTNSYARYMYSSAVDSGAWTRLVLQVDDNHGIGRVDLWTKSYEPKKVTVYEAIEYDINKNIKLRNDENLNLVGTVDIENSGYLRKYSINSNKPSAPANFSAQIDNSRVMLSWDKVPVANSYNVKRGLSINGPFSLLVSGYKGTSYVDNNVVNGTTYYYVVTSINAVGESDSSHIVQVEPRILPPTTPLNLSAQSSENEVVLSWNPVDYATEYRILRSIGDEVFIELAVVTSNSYVDSGLNNGLLHNYIVIAKNTAGESAPTVAIEATPNRNTLNKPTNLRANADNKFITLSWDTVEGATSYRVLRGDASSGPYSTIAEKVYGNTFIDMGLVNSRTYYYVVIAMNNEAVSDKSSEVAATPGVSIPLQPQNFVANAGESRVTLSWDAASYASSYTVYRAVNAGGTFKPIAQGISGTGYTDTNLVNGTTYYYYVKASNSVGDSPNSETLLAIPKQKSGTRVILSITMVNGMEKDYDLSQSQLVDFLNWYRGMNKGNGTPYYTIATNSNMGPYVNKKDYILFSQILYFEMNEYNI